MPTSLDTPTAANLVAGEWRSAADRRPSHNPAHPTEVVVEFADASDQDIDDACLAATQAQPAWSAVPAIVRGRAVRAAAIALADRREATARLLCRDMGKTLVEARGEIDRTVEILHFHANQATAENGRCYPSDRVGEQITVVRRPVGVVGVVTPFNFPLAVAAWKIAPALVHGNTVVWKAADAAPAAGVVLAEVLLSAGIPAGVVNLLQGGGSVGAALVAHEALDAVTFTGSVRVGRAIAARAAARGIPAQLELGGHNAAIVFADADLERAARSVIAGVMPGAGQRCTSTRRVIVESSIHDRFLDLMTAELGRLRLGDGLQEDVDLGPLVSATALDGVTAAVDRATADGAERIDGGTVVGDLDGGHYHRPTLLTGVRPDSDAAQEEIFGPVSSVLHADDDDQALAIANGTRFGLSTAVFTRDERRIRRFTAELDVGIVHVNSPTTGALPHVAFSGRRDSGAAGTPPEQGEQARDFYTWQKTIYSDSG